MAAEALFATLRAANPSSVFPARSPAKSCAGRPTRPEAATAQLSRIFRYAMALVMCWMCCTGQVMAVALPPKASVAEQSRAYVAAMHSAQTSMPYAQLRAHAQTEFARLGLASALANGTGAESADLRGLFEALHLLAFTSPTAENALGLRDFASSPNVAALLGQKDLRQVYSVLVSARQFVAAQAWQARLNEAAREHFPRLVDTVGDSSRRSVWVAKPKDDVLERLAAPELAGRQVVVVAGLGCHFSQAATRDIAANAALSARLAPLTQWVVLPESQVGFRELQQWNATHPALELRLMHRLEDWPFIERRATPQFFFLNDGKVVARVSGWPKEGNAQALIEALNALESKRRRED